MVLSRNVTFKVNKQTPTSGPPPQAYGTVINFRKPGGKRAIKAKKEPKSQRVRLTKVPTPEAPDGKRKRDPDDFDDGGLRLSAPSAPAAFGTGPVTSPDRPALAMQEPHLPKPAKFRKGVPLSKSVDLDCWFTILRFSDPAQLLEMRTKIASCYRFLRDNPMLWKHSRTFYYNGTLPDLPSELTEFQYAHLRHGHGCMSCHTPSTRKTYWAFLRRWCKTCLQEKTIKEHEAILLLKDLPEEDLPLLLKCLPSGIFDSWGNFVGVGPSSTHSLKTVYLLQDVEKFALSYTNTSEENIDAWPANKGAWMAARTKVIEERRGFARAMELWEDHTRQSRSSDFYEKKAARKKYFREKAAELTPPISASDLEACASYKRAVVIPKAPNMLSWLQLKPKVEKEVADNKSQKNAPFQHHLPLFSQSGNSTPSTGFY